MSFRSALHQFLRDQVNVSVSDGALPLRPMMPHLVQHFITARSTPTHTGPASILPRRVQVDAYADNDAECDRIATDVIDALDGFHGLMGSTPIGWVALLNDLETTPVQMKNAGMRFRRILDFEVAHQRLEEGSS
jgi:hypothetical protein